MYEDILVSVVIPTYSRGRLLLERSIPSVMAQTHWLWELHVVGDGATQEVDEAMATIHDPRIRYTNRPRQAYPEAPYSAWMCRGADAINYGLDTAKGPFVTTLGDDDELMPNFMDALLTAMDHQDLDLVYGRSEIMGTGGYLGDGRPQCGSQTNSMLWRLNEVRQDPQCYRTRGLPNDWVLFSDLMDSGLRWGFTPEVVHRYYPSTYVPGFSLE